MHGAQAAMYVRISAADMKRAAPQYMKCPDHAAVVRDNRIDAFRRWAIGSACLNPRAAIEQLRLGKAPRQSAVSARQLARVELLLKRWGWRHPIAWARLAA